TRSSPDCALYEIGFNPSGTGKSAASLQVLFFQIQVWTFAAPLVSPEYMSMTTAPRASSSVMKHSPFAGGRDAGARFTQLVPVHCHVSLNASPPAVGMTLLPPNMIRCPDAASSAAQPPVIGGGAVAGVCAVQIDPFQVHVSFSVPQ